jgi:hypothetical protein
VTFPFLLSVSVFSFLGDPKQLENRFHSRLLNLRWLIVELSLFDSLFHFLILLHPFQCRSFSVREVDIRVPWERAKTDSRTGIRWWPTIRCAVRTGRAEERS